MRRLRRFTAFAMLTAFAAVLGGCGTSSSGFDPSDLLDFLDTKKKLPGDRKAVFPEGVPGLQSGVPKELYRGAQAEPDPVSAAPVAQAPSGRKAVKARVARKPAREETAAEEGGTAAAPPPPREAKSRVVRRSTTAPPPDEAPTPVTAAPPPARPAPAQAASTPFPAPLPSGSFTR